MPISKFIKQLCIVGFSETLTIKVDVLALGKWPKPKADMIGMNVRDFKFHYNLMVKELDCQPKGGRFESCWGHFDSSSCVKE